MKRAIKFIVCVILSTVVLTSGILCLCGVDITRLNEQLPLIRKVCAAESEIAENAYFNIKEGTGDIDDWALRGITSSLDDDYATYLTADEATGKRKTDNGEMFGLGVLLATEPETNKVCVIYVHKNSAAASAGIAIGDVLVRVKDINVTPETLDTAVDELTANKSQTVEIEVERKGESIVYTVTTTDYIGDTVRYEMIDGVAYIKITEFDHTTKEQFDAALKAIREISPKGYVIDLRKNPGGFVDTCLEMLDILLPKCETLRYQDKNGNIRIAGTSDDACTDIDCAILIDSDSASCAEMFAINMRDHGDATLVGEKSYGKGIVQTTYSLYDGSSLKFTTELVIDKNGESYHGEGIKPDIEVVLTDEEKERFYFLGDDDRQLNTALDLFR